MKKTYSFPTYLILIAIIAVLWPVFGIYTAVLFLGLYAAFMWLNVTIATLSNALLNNPTPAEASLLRFIYILIASVCLAICIL